VPAVLGDLTPITGYENAETFSLARIDPSPIANVFEKELQLQFRFRQGLGVPIMNNSLPVIVPLHMDFMNTSAKDIGEFPITYVIKFSESDKAIVGTIVLRLDPAKRDVLKKPNFNATMKLLKKNSPPALAPGKRTEPVDLGFLADGFEGLAQVVSAHCEQVHPRTLKARAFEERNGKDVWTDFVTETGDEFIFVDQGDDGILDRVFLLLRGADWLELGPDSDFPYIPLSNIVDASGDTCFIANLVASLGVKRKSQ